MHLPDKSGHLPSLADVFAFTQVPDLHSLSIVSLLAAVTALSYCTIGFGGSVKAGKQPDAVYNLDHLSKAAGIFGVFSGLGTIAFSFGGHTVVLEVFIPPCF